MRYAMDMLNPIYCIFVVHILYQAFTYVPDISLDYLWYISVQQIYKTMYNKYIRDWVQHIHAYLIYY